jgi:hypothetical protein
MLLIQKCVLEGKPNVLFSALDISFVILFVVSGKTGQE